MADYNGLGLFDGKDKPTPAIAWKFYDKGLGFNAQIKLEENVKTLEPVTTMLAKGMDLMEMVKTALALLSTAPAM